MCQKYFPINLGSPHEEVSVWRENYIKLLHSTRICNRRNAQIKQYSVIGKISRAWPLNTSFYMC